MNSIKVIAEIGSNWVTGRNKLDGVLRAVQAASEAGADGVKFQIGLEKLYSTERAPEIHTRLQNLAFPVSCLITIKETTKALNIDLWASIFDIKLARVCAPYLDSLKVASGDITYLPMISAIGQAARQHGLPMAISTGGATLAEIDTAIDTALMYSPPELILMACNSEYPADPEKANLASILAFEGEVDTLGYSDHTQGWTAALVAIGMGCRVFEKHFAPWTNPESPDYEISIKGDEFKQYVKMIRHAEKIYGTGARIITEAEKKERLWARRGNDGLRPVDEVREIGIPISRTQALQVAKQILEHAEQERTQAAAYGIQPEEGET